MNFPWSLRRDLDQVNPFEPKNTPNPAPSRNRWPWMQWVRKRQPSVGKRPAKIMARRFENFCGITKFTDHNLQSYVVQYSSEPAPQFRYWRRYRIGRAKKFTIPDLMPDTKYIVCVSAEHNFGLAAMSKSIRFKTRAWFYDEEIFNPRMHLLSPIPPGLYQIGTPSLSRHKISVTSYDSIRW